MLKTSFVALAGLALLGLASPTQAHHSFAAQYDGDKPVRLSGTLQKIEWTNPHSFIHLAVKSARDGSVNDWACEGANPGAGEAALRFNLNHVVDPEARCILGGIPRHNASGLPFEVPDRICLQ